jgi:hypothetical protein
VRVQSPTVAVFAGGVVGAFLLAVFAMMYGYLNAGKARSTSAHGLHRLAGALVMLANETTRLLAATLMGGILSLLIIALTRATTTVNLPIAVRVDDFVGGLLVGVLSHVFAPWMAERLKIASQKHASGAANTA